MVERTGGYEPEAGERFRVVVYDSRSGEFDALEGIDAGNGRVFEATYDKTGLTLEVVEP